MAEKNHRIVLQRYPRCYVYIHYNPQKAKRGLWDVVYVGKGTRMRAWDDRNRSPAHARWLRDWQNLGFAPDEFVRIEFRKLTSKQAEKKEKELIAFYRRKGALLFNDGERAYDNKWLPDPQFGELR
jgi:hypothetical protein